MKTVNLIFALFMVTIWGSSCQRSELDLIFGDPNERIFDTLAARKALLVGSSHGWTTTFSPVGGGTFFFYMQFADDNRVDMVSDFNASTSAEVKNSSYVLKSIQQPNLIFDTYNYIHILSHPQNSTSGGSGGQGRLSDFEFSFESITADSVVLRGVRNNNIMVLYKATAEEATFYRSGGISGFIDRMNNYMDGKLFQLSSGTSQSPIYISANRKLVTMYDIEGDQVDITSSGFTFSVQGLELLSPITFEGVQYRTLYWDTDNPGFYLLNGDTRLYIDDTLVSPYLLPYAPRVQDVIGTSGYTILSTNPNNIPQAGTFNTWLANDLERVAAAERTFTYFAFDFSKIDVDLDDPDVTEDHNFQVRVRTASSTYLILAYRYKFSWVDKEEGLFELEYVGVSGTGSVSHQPYSQDLRQITTHRLKLGYFAIPGPSGATLVGLQSVDDPTVYLYGVLSNSV